MVNAKKLPKIGKREKKAYVIRVVSSRKHPKSSPPPPSTAPEDETDQAGVFPEA